VRPIAILLKLLNETRRLLGAELDFIGVESPALLF
jgi:hypothetical protein